MDSAHLHLVITHLPIYGSILGALVLLYGMITKSNHTRMAGYFVLLAAALGGIIAFTTGEGAEETVEKIQGIGKSLIEDHEEFAELTLIGIIGLAVVSTAGLLFTWKNWKFAWEINLLVLAVSFVCVGLVSWTGYLGGQIRHTEIGNAATQQGDGGEKIDDD